MKINNVLIPLLALTFAVGCKHAPETLDSQVPEAAPALDTTVADETALVERVPVLQKAKPATKSAKVAAPAAATTKSQSQPPLKGTLYVETDGAQGRVWGHVTMNGDKGTGTIHDWDENTWAVSVTRHGDELFAVDQNSIRHSKIIH